jgi:hypothetical protein
VELNVSKEGAAFRDEVRAFIAESHPQEVRIPNSETDLSKALYALEEMDRIAKPVLGP